MVGFEEECQNYRWEVDDNKFDDFPHFELRI